MDFCRLHEFLQVHLVGTAQYAVRVVDDGDSQRLRAACETVGVVVYVRRLADKQRVEFTYARVVLAGDHLHAESRIFCRLHKVLYGFGVARRLHLVGVREDGEVVQVILFLARGVARFLEVFLRELVDEFHVRFGNFVYAYRADALDEPFLLEHEFRTQQRGLEQAVEFLRKFQVLRAHVLPEVYREYEFRAGELVQALLNQVVDFVGNVLDDRRGLEVAHVFDARDNLVSAGLGQE